MVIKNIAHIIWHLQKSKKEHEPGAIVFIGAGCSVSAGIPTAGQIVDIALAEHKNHPDIKKFKKKPSYLELMRCLSPHDRYKIFNRYVEAATINESHTQLAQLMARGYVDYIVTVNFDNLAQKALAAIHKFPSILDISNPIGFTTRSLDQSIIHLHGTHNGRWQLNTEEEMQIASDSAWTFFTRIATDRLWIIVGYSGDDFIFDQLVKLGRFDNGLYWIGYKDHEPTARVQKALLNKPNTESFWVKGYDSDSFFKELSAQLINASLPISQKPVIEWASIPAGTFTMGSPATEVDRRDDETQHPVTLSAFKMSKYAITFDQYDQFCETTGREKPGDEGWGRGRRPVINVSWNDAVAFAEWMGCRLPTEAEWEYACRAGTITPFNTGNNLTTAQANYDGHYPYNNHAKGEFREKTMPVGSFAPNGWGLYDMHGNVWEWCNDWYGPYSTRAQTNPKGPDTGSIRVFRGGSWGSRARGCRAANRGSSDPGRRDYLIGFRLVSPK